MRKDKQKAFELRKLGRSYNEINRILGIPKSTLSLWLKNVQISKSIKNSNIQKSKTIWAKNIIQYNKIRSLKARHAAQQLQNEAAQEIVTNSQIDLKILGTALYWAEGYKRAKWSALFCNSDPVMIKLIMRFFREVCKVPEDRFRPQVQIHPHVSIQKAEDFWAIVTKLPKKLFRKPLVQLSKSSKQKMPPHRLPYGTFRVGIADVKILYKIKGWMDGLSRIFE